MNISQTTSVYACHKYYSYYLVYTSMYVLTIYSHSRLVKFGKNTNLNDKSLGTDYFFNLNSEIICSRSGMGISKQFTMKNGYQPAIQTATHNTDMKWASLLH